MTKIIGVNEWSEVTLLEDGDILRGGEDGLANAQAKSLANRTVYLKEELLKVKENTAGVDPKKKIAYLGDLEAVEQSLKQSVSDGKSLVAGAVTDQGVPTLATDSFKVIAENIKGINTGTGEGGNADTTKVVENTMVVDVDYHTNLGFTLLPGNNSITPSSSGYILRSDGSDLIQYYTFDKITGKFKFQTSYTAAWSKNVFKAVAVYGDFMIFAVTTSATSNVLYTLKLTNTAITLVNTNTLGANNCIVDIVGSYLSSGSQSGAYIYIPYMVLVRNPSTARSAAFVISLKMTTERTFSSQTTLDVINNIAPNLPSVPLACLRSDRNNPSGGRDSYPFVISYISSTAKSMYLAYISFLPITNTIGFSKITEVDISEMPSLQYTNQTAAQMTYPIPNQKFLVVAKNSNDVVVFNENKYCYYAHNVTTGEYTFKISNLLSNNLNITNNHPNEICQRTNRRNATAFSFLKDSKGKVAFIEPVSYSSSNKYYTDNMEFLEKAFTRKNICFFPRIVIGNDEDNYYPSASLGFSPFVQNVTQVFTENLLYSIRNQVSYPKMNNVISTGKVPEVKEYFLRRPFQLRSTFGTIELDVKFTSAQLLDSVTIQGMNDPLNKLVVLRDYVDRYSFGPFVKDKYNAIGMNLVVGHNQFMYESIFSIQELSGKRFDNVVQLSLILEPQIYDSSVSTIDSFGLLSFPSDAYSGFTKKLKVSLYSFNLITREKTLLCSLINPITGERFVTGDLIEKIPSSLDHMLVRFEIDAELSAVDFPQTVGANMLTFAMGSLQLLTQ